jgi:RimJ/RimL family protein N-acetyltransferase
VTVLPLPDPPLADGVVALRAWRERDRDVLLAAGEDPAIVRFRGSVPVGAPAVDRWLAELQGARERGERFDLAIADALDGAALGSITLWSVSGRHRRAAVNYWVAAHARGRGVARRALALTATWAFDELRLARLELFVDPRNAASLRVAERCGFVREGLLRSYLEIAGTRRDAIALGLLPGDPRTT